MSVPAWSGRRVMQARELVGRSLPRPCGRCDALVMPEDKWIVGHIKSRAAYPELTWDPRNWRPEHDACSRPTAQAAVQENAARRALRDAARAGVSSARDGLGQPPLLPFSLPGDLSGPAPTSPDLTPFPTVSREPLEVRSELGWDADRLAAWPWLRPFLEIPDDAAAPLAMTPPHPEAVGSYGAQIIAWAEEELGIRLRWWQRLAIVRQHEHREDGSLCWREVVESAPRRAGKSVRIRTVALWRLAHADLIGEVQNVIHCGNDLPICREIQRGAWRWAESKAWDVTKANGKEAIEAPDGSRWLVRSQDGVYGYDCGLGAVDEAWDVKPDTVTEGLEPAMLERLWAQLHITSTAHRRATSLMRSKMSAALAADSDSTLLLYWGAPPQDDPGDPETWRRASPHWSEDRRRMIADKYDKALIGEVDPEADDPDPMEAFRAQYLNTWVLKAGPVRKGNPIMSAEEWETLKAEQLPAGAPVAAAVESWFDAGASVALAWQADDGAAVVQVIPVPDVAAAAYVLKQSGYRGAVTVGASIAKDPALRRLNVTPGQGRGLAAVLELRRLVNEGQLRHAASSTLSDQILAVRTLPGADGPRLASRERTDAIKAALWAAAGARGQRRVRVRRLVTSG